MIKRVAAVPGDPRPEARAPATADRVAPSGKLVQFGDNAAWSYDSRQLGYLPAERLLGVVVSQITLQAAKPRSPCER